MSKASPLKNIFTAVGFYLLFLLICTIISLVFLGTRTTGEQISNSIIVMLELVVFQFFALVFFKEKNRNMFSLKAFAISILLTLLWNLKNLFIQYYLLSSQVVYDAYNLYINSFLTGFTSEPINVIQYPKAVLLLFWLIFESRFPAIIINGAYIMIYKLIRKNRVN